MITKEEWRTLRKGGKEKYIKEKLIGSILTGGLAMGLIGIFDIIFNDIDLNKLFFLKLIAGMIFFGIVFIASKLMKWRLYEGLLNNESKDMKLVKINYIINKGLLEYWVPFGIIIGFGDNRYSEKIGVFLALLCLVGGYIAGLIKWNKIENEFKFHWVYDEKGVM